MENTIEALQKILSDSNYTVALCGSGMMEESGFIGITKCERAYEIEQEYGASPEELFSSGFYNTRADQFFKFYKKEILSCIPEPSLSSYTLAAMERMGYLQCIITSNIFEQEQRGGCEYVINLHGTVYENHCVRCGRQYQVEDILKAKKAPHCEKCSTVIRPGVSLFGEMVDSRVMTKTTEEIEKAEVLLVLGSTLKSEVFSHYIRYFNGKSLVVIHAKEHFSDVKADIAFVDEPRHVLSKLKL